MIKLLTDFYALFKLLTGRTQIYWMRSEHANDNLDSLFKVAYDSAGMDLKCQRDIVIPVGQSLKVPVGIHVLPDALPFNLAIAPQIWTRSGVSTEFKIEKGAGLGDNNYTGEYAIHLYNNSDSVFRAKAGTRLCQMCFPIVLLPSRTLTEVSKMPETERGSKGFGSSGK